MRIVSFNIHKGIGGRDRRYRLERIIEALRTLEPDAICLQEVDHHVARSRFDHQARLISDALGLVHSHYQLNVRLKEGGYGNLVASRYPLASVHAISLTRRHYKPRGAQLVVVQTPLGRLHLIHWHLGLRETERHWQVRRMFEHQHFREHRQLPAIAIGDTNDWRNTLASGPFAVHGWKQISSPPSRFRSFPAWLPLGALDKVFVNSGVVIQSCHIARSRLLRDASDHLPLVVDLSGFHEQPADHLPRLSLPVP
ncbi:endonuclease/exonuclease/phosphatase family protein [Planctopirus hydrillae]|uniref:Endonuclease n=1 Tax=Planctopirus hydrillae TaxID=1841610 RepID=A0A1C3EKE9_9PLAN|nr:endonuclease/exonuclease/phosphatase family protein [Planctopirus hydrillae]ODA33711.1 endonuclease [Planctopirus hydrillae]